jgi:hypothetical protein
VNIPMYGPECNASGIFSQWQPRYAEHGIATFPVQITPDGKKPAVSHYDKIGLPASAKLAAAPRFAEHNALGFICGPRSGITVVDMDDTDPKIVAEGARLFGESPLVWQTGGGKFAAAYRFNGESRSIRKAIPGLPIDLLGGGFCVAPPSKGAKQSYQIIRGSLEDLRRLPVARALDGAGRAAIPDGRRDDTIFRRLLREVRHCDDFETLLDAARTLNMDCAPPMSDTQVVQKAKQAWKYETAGNNWVGRKARASTDRDEILALSHDPHAAMLLNLLRVSHPMPDDRFAIDQIKTARMLRWSRETLRSRIDSLIGCRRLTKVHRGLGKGDPHLYRLTPTVSKI